MKKTLSLLLAASMLASMVAGCGGSPAASSSEAPASSAAPAASEASSEAPESQAAPTGEKKELTLWHYHDGDLSTLAKEYCDEYSAQSDVANVTSVQLPFGDFKKQLSVGSAAGSLPNMVFIDNCDCVAYSAMGMFKDITEQMKDNEDIHDYYEQILNTCYYEGKMYAVPANSNNMQIYYNKDMFDAAGIQKIPETWDELKADAKTLTKDGVFGFGMCAVGNEEGTFQYLPFQYTAGGDSYQLDSESGIKAMTLLADMVQEGSMPKDVVMWSQSDVQTQFKAGRLAMMFMGCWAIGGLERGQEDGSVAFEWDNFAIPKDATYGSVYGGENLAIVKGDGEEESVDFLKWFMEYDRNKKWNIDSGHFIPREKTLSDPDFTDRPHWKVVIDLIPYTNARPADPKWPEISLGYQQALQEALTLQNTPEEACKNGQAVIDAARA